jgi:hypothetical protein
MDELSAFDSAHQLVIRENDGEDEEFDDEARPHVEDVSEEEELGQEPDELATWEELPAFCDPLR